MADCELRIANCELAAYRVRVWRMGGGIRNSQGLGGWEFAIEVQAAAGATA